MALAYQIKSRARRDIERAAMWWAENRLAAPGAVRKDVEEALAALVRQPGIGTRVETERTVHVRRFLMSRTKYWLYYRVRGSMLEVICVWHSSRGSDPSL